MDAVEVFNSLPAARLEEDLLACRAAPAWGAAVVATRPYRQRSETVAAADAAARELGWAEVLIALCAHPRIGERAAGDSAEAVWSRREQAGAGRSPELVAANRAYEERFGFVFLISASGRTQEEIL